MRQIGSGAAKGIGAIVDQLLGNPDFLVGSRKLFPALLDHALGLLELGQGINADLGVLFHDAIIPCVGVAEPIIPAARTVDRRCSSFENELRPLCQIEVVGRGTPR